MRGEVLLLSSNVNITANTDETSRTPNYDHPWGCQLLIADFNEQSGDFEYRQADVNLDHVAIYNCS